MLAHRYPPGTCSSGYLRGTDTQLSSVHQNPTAMLPSPHEREPSESSGSAQAWSSKGAQEKHAGWGIWTSKFNSKQHRSLNEQNPLGRQQAYGRGGQEPAGAAGPWDWRGAEGEATAAWSGPEVSTALRLLRPPTESHPRVKEQPDSGDLTAHEDLMFSSREPLTSFPGCFLFSSEY